MSIAEQIKVIQNWIQFAIDSLQAKNIAGANNHAFMAYGGLTTLLASHSLTKIERDFLLELQSQVSEICLELEKAPK